MDIAKLERVSMLVAHRNGIDAEIGSITGWPVVAGHLGEWIAAQVFDIELENSAVSKAIDGRFRSGLLAGKTVNVKWYGMQEGLLDMSDDPALDYYLVMAGPKGPPSSSRGVPRPLTLDAVYLFDAHELFKSLTERGIKIGIATSVRTAHWSAAEIHPNPNNSTLILGPEQHNALSLFKI